MNLLPLHVLLKCPSCATTLRNNLLRYGGHLFQTSFRPVSRGAAQARITITYVCMYVVNVLLFYGIFSKYGTYSKMETVHAIERSRSGRIGDAANLLFVSQPLYLVSRQKSKFECHFYSACLLQKEEGKSLTHT